MTPSGFVDTAGPRVYLRLDGTINGVEAVKAIPVASGGKLLKIGDVAEVTRGYEDPATKKIRHQGEPSIILALVMKKGFNGLTLGKLLNAEEAAIHQRTTSSDWSCPRYRISPRSLPRQLMSS